jgi:hypothetical protein
MASPLSAEIESLTAQLQTLIGKAKNDETARKQLFNVTVGATAQLETPVETVWRLIMSPHAPAAIMTLLDMGAFEVLAKNGDSPTTAKDIAAKTGASELLIVRMFRPLVALGLVKELGEDTYAATPVSHAFTDPILKGGFTFMFYSASHSLSQMPQYLKSTGYKHVDNYPGPFQYAKKSELQMFPWLIANPDLLLHFNWFMRGQQQSRGDWFDRLDVGKIFLNGANNETPLLIDLGGGMGHDVEAFHKKYPQPKGQLLLADLPQVLDTISELDDAITRLPHDFFTPLPVKGARVYYFRGVFHDWSDDKSVEILNHVREAFKPGYSKLLINEFVLPATGPPLYPSLLDINMMAVLNGQERTRKQWTSILDRAGFKVLEFHVDPTGATEGLIEADLK